MAKIAYITRNFGAGSLQIIRQANEIIAEYAAQGYDLTLRQLYYQFVARDFIPNRQSEYKRLGSVLNDARLAGDIDCDAITDRTRNLRALSHWTTPDSVIASASYSYRLDRWDTQPYHVEVWVEKEALAGVVERVATANDVPFFSCRGYVSQSELHAAAKRLEYYQRQGNTPLVLHLGDHDPSGIDMTRDIRDRLALFMGGAKVERLALNMDQVEQFNPPPNPAKESDSRFGAYIADFGEESWELDALDPATLNDVIQRAIDAVIDRAAWERVAKRETGEKRLLELTTRRWPDVVRYLRQHYPEQLTEDSEPEDDEDPDDRRE